MPRNRLPIALVALTNIRVLMGQRVADATDLQVLRDNLNRFVIPGTSLKGCFRSRLFLSLKNGELLTSMLFGSTDEKIGSAEVKGHIGAVGFSDAYLVFIPVPSTKGILFVTSPLLLQKLFWAMGLDTKVLSEIQNSLSDNEILVNLDAELVDIAGGITLKAIKDDFVGTLQQILSKILSNTKLTEILGTKIGVVSDGIIDVVLQKALIIRPGIKIKGFEENTEIYEKVVSATGPRFEEEIPLGSIFVGSINLLRNKIRIKMLLKNAKDTIAEMIAEGIVNELKIGTKDNALEITLSTEDLKKLIDQTNPIFIGSKETLTKGLTKVIPIDNIETGLNKPKITKRNAQKIHIRKKTIKINEVIKTIEEIFKKKLEELVDDLNKKVAGLPEKFRTMDPLTTLYFYTTIKADSEGKGYKEIYEVAEHFLKRKELSEIKIESGLIKKGNEEYLEYLDYVIQFFTILKYILRSYGEKK